MNKLVLVDSSISFEIEIKDANTGETTIINFDFGTSRSKMFSLLKELPKGIEFWRPKAFRLGTGLSVGLSKWRPRQNAALNA